MANKIITIARQYGASGRFTGEILSELLGIPCYDRELITMSVDKSGMKEDIIENFDEKSQSSLLYTLAVGSVEYSAVTMPFNMPISDKLFIHQSDIIKELADKSSCILVGRCADYVLRDHDKKISVFLEADLNVRAERVAKRHGIPISKAQDLCIKTDKKRASYYSHYTGRKWGRSELYDLVINTTKLDAKGAAAVIKAYWDALD